MTCHSQGDEQRRLNKRRILFLVRKLRLLRPFASHDFLDYLHEIYRKSRTIRQPNNKPPIHLGKGARTEENAQNESIPTPYIIVILVFDRSSE